MTESLRQDEFDRIFSTVPRLTVEVLITSEERGVLLALRDVDPCRGMWNLPGGTVRFGERLVDAVRRVAAGELDVSVRVGALVGYRVPQPLRERA
jgi:ADP-ribose pyrophosphatase YjhB (NUDIX family)